MSAHITEYLYDRYDTVINLISQVRKPNLIAVMRLIQG